MTLKPLLSLVSLFCLTNLAFALDGAAPLRTTLDGDWHYIVDPQEIGFRSYHDATDSDRDNMLYGRNLKPRRPSDLIEYDFAAAPTLKVPGDWNTQKPELYYYEGSFVPDATKPRLRS